MILSVDFTFTPSYLVTSTSSVSWVIQKVLSGATYPRPEDVQPTSFLSQTLAAFAHYAIERYDIFLDAFEGETCHLWLTA